MNADLTYREGSIIEKEALQQLGILSYSQFSQILSPADWTTMHRFLHNDKMWDQLVNNSKIFVCDAGDKLAGMAYLVSSNNPTRIYPADWSYVRMVGVDPAYRGKGIARRMTQMCVDYARDTNEKIVGLHTSEKMQDAIHVYESIGFKLYKEIDPIYGMRYFVYRMEIS
jgi:ribosomal protein S18 acetylase RimI-like enzyme